jgi:hypothetical protein
MKAQSLSLVYESITQEHKDYSDGYMAGLVARREGVCSNEVQSLSAQFQKGFLQSYNLVTMPIDLTYQSYFN